MKKNKKLKSQFKKLLNEQIHKAIKENPDFKEEKEEKSGEDYPKDSRAKNIQESFAKKDILKTVIISAVIIGAMITFSFVLNKYGLFEKAIDFILRMIGAK